MTDSEKKVTYRAVANFTALGRSVDNITRKFQKLRKEQALLNAESAAAAGSYDKATAALNRQADSRGKHVKAIDEEIASTGKHAAALSQEAQQAERTAAAISRGAAAAQQAVRAKNDLAGASSRAKAGEDAVAGAASRAAAAGDKAARAFERSAASSARAAAGHRRQGQELSKLQVAFNNTLTRATRLKAGLDKLGNWRPRLIPPFIAIVPIIAGVVAAINPLIAGLGAASSAALGFGSSIGTLAGAAIGVIPALSSLLGVVGALRLAFGGIGNAFKAAGKMNKAGGGGGGGSKDKQIELTQAEKITRAQEKLRRAYEDVGFAEDDLVQARKAYIDQLKTLQKQIDRVAQSEARAAANSRLAQENYANVLADPGSTKGQKMDAQVAVTEALSDQKDVRDDNKKAAQELADMKKKGIEGDRDVIMAERGVTDAINAVRDAQIDLQNAQKGTNEASSGGASAADEYAAALAKLSPSARSVVEQLVAMRGEFEKMQRTVQESFFSQFVDDIQLLRRLFPPLTKLFSNLAAAAGDIVSQLIQKVTSDSWIADIYKFADESVKPVHDIGEGLLSLLEAFKDLTIAALPFLTALAEGFKEGAKNFSDLVATARQDGSLAAYLERVRSKMAQWWRIIKNIGSAIYNYGKAAGDLGDWLTDGFEKTTKGWSENAKNAAKAGSPFRQYLEDIKPLLSNMNGLLGDFFKWVGKTAMSKDFIDQMNEIVTIFRKRLGPAIGDILDTLAKTGVSVALTDALASLAELIDTILKNGGAAAIKNFFKAVDVGFKALSDFAKIPGVGTLITVLFQGLAGLAALTFVGKFTGLTSLLGLLIKAGKSGGVKGLFKNLGGLGKGGASGAASAVGGAAAGEALGGALGGGRGSKGGKGGLGGLGGALGGLDCLPMCGGDCNPCDGMGGGSDTYVGGPDGKGKKGITNGEAGKYLTRKEAIAAEKAAAREASMLGRLTKGLKGGVGALAAFAGLSGLKGVFTKMKNGATLTTGGARAAKGGVGLAAKDLLGIFSKGGGARNAEKGLTVLGTLGKVGKGALSLVKGIGPASLIGSVAGAAISGTAAEGKKGSTQRVTGNIVSGAATGAGIGATVGSVIPGVGTAVGGAVGGVVGGAAGFFSSSKEDKQKFLDDIGTFFTKTVPDFLSGLGSSIWDGLVSFGEWLGSTWDDAMAWLGSLPDKIGQAASDLWGGVKDFGAWLGEKWEDAKQWFADLPYNIGYAIGELWKNVKDFGTWLGEKWEEAKDWVANLPQLIADTAADVWAKTKTFLAWLGEKWTEAKQWVADLPNKIKNAAGDIWRTLKALGSWLAEKWEGARQWVADLPNKIKNAAGDIWRSLKAFAGWLGEKWEAARTWLADLPNKIGKAAGDIWSGLTDVGDWLKNQGKKIVDWAKDTASTIGDKVGDFVQGVKDGASGKKNKNKKYNGGIIRRANGGSVPGTRANSDTVPAMLTPGEFVVRKKIVDRIGADNLAKLNSGVLSYAQMLQAAQMSAKAGKAMAGYSGSNGMLGFSVGGMVPNYGTGQASSLPRALTSQQGAQSVQNIGTIIENLNITNPVPERASESVPKALRRTTYLGSK